MWIFAKLKLWEVLLVVAICLLGALVYETHNAPGRYIPLLADNLQPGILLDTSTGKVWKYDVESKEWTLKLPAIPNRSHSMD